VLEKNAAKNFSLLKISLENRLPLKYQSLQTIP
jgi:hypothetical protein